MEYYKEKQQIILFEKLQPEILLHFVHQFFDKWEECLIKKVAGYFFYWSTNQLIHEMFQFSCGTYDNHAVSKIHRYSIWVEKISHQDLYSWKSR